MKCIVSIISTLCLTLTVAPGAAILALTSAGVQPVCAQSSPASNNDPKAVMMYNLGITAYRQGSTDAAVIFFKRACDIDPDLADAQYNLAVIYQSQKRYKEAIERFEEVLRIKQNDPDAHYQLALILQDSGRYADARQHFSAIPPNNPHFAEAQKRIAQLNSTTQGPTGSEAQPPVTQAPPALNSGAAQPPAYPPGLPTATYPPVQAQPQVNPSMNQSAAAQAVQGSMQNPGLADLPPNSSVAQTKPTTAANPVPVMADTTLKVFASGFNAPSGIAFDRSGTLYVANYNANSIERIAPDGTRVPFASGRNLWGPIGLVADEAGNLYVANYNGGTVARINPAGVCSLVASGFKKPYYLTLDKDGNLYVSQQEDNSVVRIQLPHAGTATASKAP